MSNVPATGTAPTSSTDQEYAKFEARVLAADWREIARGYYAVPILDDHGDPEDPGFGQFLGYKLFERRMPRILKNGRKVGRDQWCIGAAYVAEGTSRERLDEYMQASSINPRWTGSPTSSTSSMTSTAPTATGGSSAG
jgi:hypothetical protein